MNLILSVRTDEKCLMSVFKKRYLAQGLPDHCIFAAKSSFVSSGKQGKQKPNTCIVKGLSPKTQ